MEIKEIKNKDIWEDFLGGCKEKSFLQSWNWGEFQERMGNKIWRLGIYDNDELISTVLVSKISAKRGNFLLIQHGPNIKPQATRDKRQVLITLLEELQKIGKGEKADFIRMAPLLERNEENQNILKKLGFREAPMHANAYEATWKLDITIPEEELLQNMRKTTRYLIRQAIKNTDITVEKSERLDDTRIFIKISIGKWQKGKNSFLFLMNI